MIEEKREVDRQGQTFPGGIGNLEIGQSVGIARDHLEPSPDDGHECHRAGIAGTDNSSARGLQQMTMAGSELQIAKLAFLDRHGRFRDPVSSVTFFAKATQRGEGTILRSRDRFVARHSEGQVVRRAECSACPDESAADRQR